MKAKRESERVRAFAFLLIQEGFRGNEIETGKIGDLQGDGSVERQLRQKEQSKRKRKREGKKRTVMWNWKW